MTGMFRFISALAFLMISFSVSAQFRDGAVYDDLYDGETVAALKAHVRELSASHLEGRKAGSEGEKAAAVLWVWLAMVGRVCWRFFWGGLGIRLRLATGTEAKASFYTPTPFSFLLHLCIRVEARGFFCPYSRLPWSFRFRV